MGKLIAIEGIDGSGKGTQTAALAKAMQSRGYRVFASGFPQYSTTFFGEKVGQFLNGKFGSLAEVNPFLASLLYAGDRLEFKPILEAALSTFDFVVLDRYVSSNIGHQCAKLTDQAERHSLRRDIERLEYEIHGMPKPFIQVFLDMPPKIATQLVAAKKGRDYTQLSHDIHEADVAYQVRVQAAYQELFEHMGRGFSVSCVEKDGSLSDPATITDRVVMGLSTAARIF